MKLSKKIPAHTKTVEFNWCRKDFMVMCQKFRDIRSQSSNPMDSCFWCNHEFVDGEMMALAQPKKGVNKPLCQKCATLLLRGEEGEMKVVVVGTNQKDREKVAKVIKDKYERLAEMNEGLRGEEVRDE